MSRCVCCRVTGRVQGVWFRSSTRQQALGLGITGYARNLSDGSVEVVACGGDEVLKVFCEWLWQGPSKASVLNVTCEDLEKRDYSNFTTA